MTIYGQQEVVKDLIAARLERGGDAALRGRPTSASTTLESERPRISTRADGSEHELECDFIAGCDGFHGVCRAGDSRRLRTQYEYDVSVRVARDPGRGLAGDRRADLRVARARLRAVHDALVEDQPPVHPGAGRRAARATGPTSGSGQSSRPGSPARAGASTRARSSRRGSRRCAASCASRCATAACSCRRRRAHRPADRRQGPEPRGQRRRACSPRRSRSGTATEPPPGSTRYSRHGAAAGVAGAGLLQLHDPAPARPRQRPVSTAGCSSRGSSTCERSAAAATSLAENYAGLPARPDF